MKIYVEKVLDEFVYFSTDYGNAKGIWKGNNRPIDKVYYIEMDIDMLCDYESFVLCDHFCRLDFLFHMCIWLELWRNKFYSAPDDHIHVFTLRLYT